MSGFWSPSEGRWFGSDGRAASRPSPRLEDYLRPKKKIAKKRKRTIKCKPKGKK